MRPVRIFRQEKLIDREKEIVFLKDWLEILPKEILWIYGPKSSGKTTLIEYVIENELIGDIDQLGRNEFWIKYINFRRTIISNYSSFIEALFEEKDEEEKVFELNRKYKLGIFELEAKTLKKIKEKKKNLFHFLIDELDKINKQKAIVIDEIQILEDIYINGGRELLKEFLNFCVALTKETHLSHVVILSSNMIFVEKIYNDAKLKKTSTFFKVDHLERKTVEQWLKEENFPEQDIDLIWEYLGGSIFDIQRLLINVKRKEFLNEYLENQKWLSYTEIVEALAKLKSRQMEETFKKIAQIIIHEKYYMCKTNDYEEREVIEKLAEKEILFFDPLTLRVTGNNRLYEKGMELLLADNGM